MLTSAPQTLTFPDRMNPVTSLRNAGYIAERNCISAMYTCRAVALVVLSTVSNHRQQYGYCYYSIEGKYIIYIVKHLGVLDTTVHVIFAFVYSLFCQ